jgi:hypothetical protein
VAIYKGKMMDLTTWFLLGVIAFLIMGWANSKPLFWALLGLMLGYAIGKNNEPLKEALNKFKETIK